MASALLLRHQPSSRLAFQLLRGCTPQALLSRSSTFVFNKASTREFHATIFRRNSNAKPPAEPIVTEEEQGPLPHKQLQNHREDQVYHGPLAKTFRRLKIFSLSSLTLSFALTPFIFIIETTSAVPMAARFVLAGVALSTSSISTALVAWCGRPYVSTLRWLPTDPLTLQDGTKGPEVIELTTHTLGLKPRVTRVYDTAFLIPTNRPFAKWELAEVFRLSPSEVEAEKAKGLLPREETVAETTDDKGNIVGRWIVQWDGNGLGTCRQHGQVDRYFNVHEELLPQPVH